MTSAWKLFLSATIAFALGFAPDARAQGVEFVKANYTKYEFNILMRDGVRLFTSVYVPKSTASTWPIMLTRTPYTVAPYGSDQYRGDLGPSIHFAKSSYIFAYQDVRGRYMSEGKFENMRPTLAPGRGPKEIDESTDAYDTIDWLVKNVPGNNGRVGQWGISYPGFYTACALIDAHPALKAASPQAPVTDWFIGDDWHHNGAFFVTHAFNFLAAFGHPRPEPTKKANSRFEYATPDGYKFFLDLGPLPNADARYMKGDVEFWTKIMEHGSYDEFWKARNLRPHLRGVRPAVMTVGGWFDAENLFGALECYRNIEKSSPGIQNTLVMGPWFHGGWSRGDGASLGDVKFNAKTAEFYQEKIEFPFFEQHLKGSAAPRPEAWVFQTGRNQWREHAQWPPASAKPRTIHLQPGGKLDFDPADKAVETYDEYVSDPRKPVPFVGFTTNQMAREYMVADQRFAAARPDVLVYQMPIVDRDLTVAGPIQVDLLVSTSGTDADFVVKLIDVYPEDDPSLGETPNIKMGGYQQLLRGDVMRGKFREGFDAPKAFKPGEPTRVAFTMPDCYHTFRPGHKLMIQIQSTWFPLVDRNPQKFVDIYNAKDEDFQTAAHRIHHGSKIEILVEP